MNTIPAVQHCNELRRVRCLRTASRWRSSYFLGHILTAADGPRPHDHQEAWQTSGKAVDGASSSGLIIGSFVAALEAA